MQRLKQIGIDVEINGVIEKNRRAFSESENDILRRLLLGIPEIRTSRAPAMLEADQAPARQRGLWTVELNGARRPAPNLKGAYKALLLELQKLDSTFLQRFSSERSRSRRFVSRQPGQLFLTSPAIAKGSPAVAFCKSARWRGSAFRCRCCWTRKGKSWPRAEP